MENILLILYKTVICYTVLIVVMKIMGKREIGQLSLFDLLVLLSIADITVIGIENFNKNIMYTLTPVLFLALSQKIISYISLKSSFVRKIFDGKESVIVADGKLQLDNMKRLKYNMDDLLMQLRQKDIRSLGEVEYAILETNGLLSVFKYHQNSNDFPLPLIVSGKVEKENVLLYHYTEAKLEQDLKKKRLTKEDILVAYISNQRLVFIKREN